MPEGDGYCPPPRLAGESNRLFHRAEQCHCLDLAFNLVLDENVFPELLKENCTPEKLTGAAAPLLADTQERDRQRAGRDWIADKILADGAPPSERAAETSIALMEAGIQKRLSVPR